MDEAVRFEDVSRRFGSVRALDGVSFSVLDGEFFSILGPSGSGKTTCLRLIAGFEHPSVGRVLIYGRDMAGVPPYERDVNTVFQDYALFPHMSVEENVGYGLMVNGVPKAERAGRVEETLALVRLAGLGRRRPAALSGGQRQRVALARALINHPRVLVLDEPLGALDLKLREEMQVELKAIQRSVGITFIYVTHDQHEALGMSDRLAVFNEGRIEQIGSPTEIYESPATVFVAAFVGASNILEGRAALGAAGAPGPFSIRPEKIRLARDGDASDGGPCRAAGTIEGLQYHGASSRYVVALDDGGRLNVVVPNDQSADACTPGAGERVELRWERAAMRPLKGPLRAAAPE
ncbi:MAG: ABC transporter ATP-binding protein [Alphaproteobacteria bacterium]